MSRCPLFHKGTQVYGGNTDYARIILIVADKNVHAEIAYLDESADLAFARGGTICAGVGNRKYI